jgi:hypothetical protein
MLIDPSGQVVPKPKESLASQIRGPENLFFRNLKDPAIVSDIADVMYHIAPKRWPATVTLATQKRLNECLRWKCPGRHLLPGPEPPRPPLQTYQDRWAADPRDLRE